MLNSTALGLNVLRTELDWDMNICTLHSLIKYSNDIDCTHLKFQWTTWILPILYMATTIMHFSFLIILFKWQFEARIFTEYSKCYILFQIVALLDRKVPKQYPPWAICSIKDKRQHLKFVHRKYRTKLSQNNYRCLNHRIISQHWINPNIASNTGKKQPKKVDNQTKSYFETSP